MSENSKGFYFERMRGCVGRRALVIQGYTADGYMDTIRPRAAIFVGDKPVKALKCSVETVKLPPIMMKRRNGDVISYKCTIFIDFTDVSEAKLERYGDSARFVLVGEKLGADEIVLNRDKLFLTTIKHVRGVLDVYNMSVDVAYTEDGKTILKGWLGGTKSTVVNIQDIGNGSETDELLKYNIKFSVRDDVLLLYPECPDDAELGFEITLDGEYRKLKVRMSEGGVSCEKKISVGKTSDEFSSSNVISRYSEKVVRNLKNYGVRETASRIRIRLSPSYVNLNRHYEKWIKKVSPTPNALEGQRNRQKTFAYRPLMSVLVPLYETDEKFLDELIKSIQAQTYPNWEICFSDGSRDIERLKEIVGRYSSKDERIRYIADAPVPLGISSNTNQAFSIAKGDFIILGDHDDLFTPDAFYSAVAAINSEGSDVVDVLYTDEDKTNSTAKKRFEPNIKPDFNQELLESCNYITHMFVARKSLVDEVGLFDDEYNGAQDYDFILRCTEKARKIVHIPKIVYSWRINETSTAGNPAAKMYAYDAGVKALQAHYERVGIKAKAEIGDHLGYYHTKYEIPEGTKLYVAVTYADDEENFVRTMDSIKSKSDFKNISFLKIRSHDGKRGLARQLNRAVSDVNKQVEAEGLNKENVYICFIESGVTMMGEEGLSNMLGYITNRKKAGAIGGKLYAVGGTISHSGIIVDMGNLEGWMYARHSKLDEMYFNYSAYTALRRGAVIFGLADLEKYGEFDERYSGEYAIIDYTYRMTLDGRVSIYDANAEFQIRTGRGRDADSAFETIPNKLKEFSIFVHDHTEINETGDKYYSNSIRKLREE